MFPVVKVCLRGLDPEKNYMVYMDMAAVDTRRYRYVYPRCVFLRGGIRRRGRGTADVGV